MSRVQQLRDLLAADCISQTEYARLMPAAMLSDQQDAYGQAVYRHHGEGLLGVGHAIANQALRAQSYLTRTAAAPPQPTLPDVAIVARALFETDHDVCSFMSRISDNVLRFTETRWNTELGRSETVAVPGVNVAEIRPWRPEHMQAAWDRNQNGWRSRAEQRAAALLAHLAKVPR